MKLKCKVHDRRVMVFGEKVVHREDGSRCETRKVVLGDRKLSPKMVRPRKPRLAA